MNYNTKIYYRYCNDSKILYKNYKGIIDIEDIISSWKYAFKRKLFSRELKGIILDYREASFNSSIEIDRKIIVFYQENLLYFRGLRIAVITSSLEEIIVPLLVSHGDKYYLSAPFLCLEHGRNWITENSCIRHKRGIKK